MDANRVIGRLQYTIGALHVEMAKMEALNEHLATRIKELEGVGKNAGVRSTGKHNGGAEGSYLYRPRQCSTEAG